ncbi:MAG: hypothetical protein Edafosvirus6_28 [Edafosvirus sp.]|uniref:Uncharacterized protein n=1 Tax=Edafosvirus sp. TaxID=2487765 RepID=A0A3G4ZXN4_9VIRU|nr:MAG: hypothetical protein Edafosvirus6_28 [Edafosvirus sp.]
MVEAVETKSATKEKCSICNDTKFIDCPKCEGDNHFAFDCPDCKLNPPTKRHYGFADTYRPECTNPYCNRFGKIHVSCTCYKGVVGCPECWKEK